MSAHEPRDAEMDRLLRAALTSARPSDAGACPDGGMLAAFVEGGLSQDEQAAIESHLARCSRCQEALAIVGLDASAPDAGRQSAAEPARSGWFTWVAMPRLRWLVPITAAATVAVFFFATRPLIAPGDEASERSPETRMARATPPDGAQAERVEEQAALATRPSADVERSAAQEAPGSKGERERTTADSPAVPAERREAAKPAPAAPGTAAAPVPAAAPGVAPAATLAAGNVPARADLEDKRTKVAAEFAAVPADVAESRPQLAAKAAPAPSAAGAAGEGRRAAMPESLQLDALSRRKDTALQTNEVAQTVISAPGGAVRWRLGTGGRVWRTTDAGVTWRELPSGTTADLAAGSAPGPTTCWVVGGAGTVLVTEDGESWRRVPFPLAVDLAGVRAADARSAVVAARDGRRFETRDGGLTWR